MATATYRIGPSDFFTPGDLKADADTLNGQVDELDAQIEGNTALDQTLVDQWTAFHQSWRDFYGKSFGGFFTNLFTSLNDSNRDQLIQFEAMFGNFAAELAQQGASLAGGVVAPSGGSGDTLGAQLGAQLGGAAGAGLATKAIVIVALIVVALFIWKK
jgi:hypothetical protein